MAEYLEDEGTTGATISANYPNDPASYKVTYDASGDDKTNKAYITYTGKNEQKVIEDITFHNKEGKNLSIPLPWNTTIYLPPGTKIKLIVANEKEVGKVTAKISVNDVNVHTNSSDKRATCSYTLVKTEIK